MIEEAPDLSQLTNAARERGGVTAPLGFTAAATSAHIRTNGEPDLALIVAEKPVSAAAVFTQNTFAAAPVIVSREHIRDGRIQAVLINAGNANAATGERGIADARASAAAVAREVGCDPHEVIVASTGVIGEFLPEGNIVAAIPATVEGLSVQGGSAVARAIMTTDTHPKEIALSLDVGARTVTIGGMAKGSGMIQPDMATMLAVLTTDAPLTPNACRAALTVACSRSFNRVTVDADTSTNDMCALLASGEAGGEEIDVNSPELETFTHALTLGAISLARMIASDGEGATKLMTVTVTGAVDEADAVQCARTIANSPLVKTAVFGHDANWGRVAMAAGRSGVAFDQTDLSIDFLGLPVCRAGVAVGFDEEEALRRFCAPEITIEVDLGAGEASATIWSCDLSYEYVKINGEYRT